MAQTEAFHISEQELSVMRDNLVNASKVLDLHSGVNTDAVLRWITELINAVHQAHATLRPSTLLAPMREQFGFKETPELALRVGDPLMLVGNWDIMTTSGKTATATVNLGRIDQEQPAQFLTNATDLLVSEIPIVTYGRTADIFKPKRFHLQMLNKVDTPHRFLLYSTSTYGARLPQ